MRWYQLTHATDGTVIPAVAAEDDQDAPPGYDPEEWSWVELTREPGPLDAVAEDGTVAPDRAKHDRRCRDLIDAEFLRRKRLGYCPTEGPLFDAPGGPHVLQLRDLNDQSNWQIGKSLYQDAVAAGYGDVAGANLRTEADVEVTLTYADAVAVLRDMETWGASLLNRKWALKSALDALDDEALVSYDPVAAWDAP